MFDSEEYEMARDWMVVPFVAPTGMQVASAAKCFICWRHLDGRGGSSYGLCRYCRRVLQTRDVQDLVKGESRAFAREYEAKQAEEAKQEGS